MVQESLEQQKRLYSEIVALKEEVHSLKEQKNTQKEPPKVRAKKKSPSLLQAKKTEQKKVIVGRVEHVYIDPPGIRMSARIDTGAQTSSINAKDIVRFERDQKKWVRFTLVDEASKQEHVIERRVVRGVKILQSSQDEGYERRVVVLLQISLGDIQELSEFTLTNREHMTYSVLVGRNLLKDQMLVDVAQKHLLGVPKKPLKERAQ